MKTCVFVASHIYYDGQLDLLSTCLQSLVEQTKKTDIKVSISFENTTFKQEFLNVLRRYNASVRFVLSPTQLFQMEHIDKLTKQFANQYEIIMFCDDDDTYKPERVDTLSTIFRNHQHLVNFSGVREIYGVLHGTPEFWCYAIRPRMLHVFFERMETHNKMQLLQHKYGDMYFRSFLRATEPCIFCEVPMQSKVPFYNHNTSNPNSITGMGRRGCYSQEERM